MPRPVEDRSDVGGAAQFNNIGPVPLSGPAFRSPTRANREMDVIFYYVISCDENVGPRNFSKTGKRSIS